MPSPAAIYYKGPINDQKINIDSKETKEILDIVYSGFDNFTSINSVDLTTEAIRKVTNMKYPESLTPVFEPAVMAGLNQVKFDALESIKGLGNDPITLGSFVGVMNKVSTFKEFGKAWKLMDDSKEKFDDINNKIKILEETTDDEKRAKLEKELNHLKYEYNQSLKGPGAALINTISAIVGEVPVIGPAYSGIIKGSTKLLDRAIDLYSKHYAEMEECMRSLGVSGYKDEKK